MSHNNHNGNRPVEQVADSKYPIIASAEPVTEVEHHKGPHVKGPHDPKEINPKMSSDIAYWSHEFGIDGTRLHELIRVHGTHVDKIRAAVHSHKTA